MLRRASGPSTLFVTIAAGHFASIASSEWLTSWIHLTFADRAVSHDVLHAMAARAWRKRELDGRVRGFEPRRGGGGTWRAHCPLCFDVRFSKPEPPLPRTLSGRPYMDMPPLLVRHVRRLVHARIVLDSGRWSDVLAHTVEVYVWAQLVGDGEAREAGHDERQAVQL